MQDVKLKIGLRIQELRNKKGWSQEKLALKSHLDRTYINSVENGRRNISIVNIEKISNSLGCSLHQFFSCEIFRH